MIDNKKKDFKCRFCSSNRIFKVIDFGSVGLAGGFLLPENFKNEKKHDQQLYFCEDCYLLQIINKIDAKLLFKDYFYFSSAISTLRKHFYDYAKEVQKNFLYLKKFDLVMEKNIN